MQNNRKEILQDLQIKKFCAYGLLKNLRFFEPYLLVYLISFDISLLEIGLLISVREIIINIFEIPSGFIADMIGRKKELCICFMFYIISFIFFFFTTSFTLALFGMIFFGLGEAFRSGTHKAMIYTYLDEKKWETEKTFVYGTTRSYSLIGSAISSTLSIILILLVPSTGYIFLFAIIPYILDFMLILSYPNYLDVCDIKPHTTIKSLIKELISVLKKNKSLRKLLCQEGIVESSNSYIKDLIQPILEMIIIGNSVIVFASLSLENNLNVVLGIVYAGFNLLASVSAKNAYLFKQKQSNNSCLKVIYIIFIILFITLALTIKNYLMVLIIYILIYIVHSARKPIFIDELDNHIEKSARSTMLSIAAQLKSLFLMILAPILGLIADNFGLEATSAVLALIFIITIPLTKIHEE